MQSDQKIVVDRCFMTWVVESELKSGRTDGRLYILNKTVEFNNENLEVEVRDDVANFENFKVLSYTVAVKRKGANAFQDQTISLAA